MWDEMCGMIQALWPVPSLQLHQAPSTSNRGDMQAEGQKGVSGSVVWPCGAQQWTLVLLVAKHPHSSLSPYSLEQAAPPA